MTIQELMDRRYQAEQTEEILDVLFFKNQKRGDVYIVVPEPKGYVVFRQVLTVSQEELDAS